MNMVARKAPLLIVLFLCQPLSAQETDFSGKWVLNHEKTQLGDMPEIVIEISQDIDTINYIRTVTSSEGTFVTRLSLPVGGSEASCADHRGNQFPCSCSFADGRLTVNSKSEQRRGGRWVIVTIEEEHSLSADRKTLSIVHKEWWGDRGGRWPSPMVFDKLSADAKGASTESETAAPGGTLRPRRQPTSKPA